MNKISLVDKVTSEYNRQRFYDMLTLIQTQINRGADGYLFSVVRQVANYTVSLNDSIVLVDATAGNINIFLQPALNWEQKRITVKKIDASANTVTINANGAELIDGSSTKVISTQYVSVEMTAQGGAVWIL